jgi:hypothetical protein
MSVLGACWAQAYFEEIPIFGGKTQFWRRTTGRKSNTCEGNMHAKEESMQGVQVGKPNHVRVRVLVSYCNN